MKKRLWKTGKEERER